MYTINKGIFFTLTFALASTTLPSVDLFHYKVAYVYPVFQGYSYVAPSVIFSDNTISSDLLKQSKDLQPDNRQLLYASHFKVS